ncbi:MAG TPA: M23 family metallopeptidase [Verrucomicrobiae bacterium]|nr:M23 family metallopeptidase [Verrucomicrobiae bacterium]
MSILIDDMRSRFRILDKKRNFPATGVRAGSLFLFVFGLVTGGFARDRGPRIEVGCLASPIPVRIDKQQVLVYELHVTNFDAVPLTLKRLEVLANEENSGALSTLADATLSGAMIRVGEAMVMSGSSGGVRDVRVIEPGGHSVIYVWIELQPNRAVPASLKHRMVFSPTAGSTIDATLEDFQVPVSRESVPTLSPPFKGGIWLAGEGPANNSNHRRTIMAIDGHIYSAERFAIDWVKVGPNGDSRHDGAAQNENWWGWGEPILAVADGEITEVVDGIPDNTPRVLPPVTLDNIAGNHIILQIAPNRYVTYAHLKNGSIKVRLHDPVRRGDVLALLGNSGNTTGAHLHMQVTDRNSVLQSQGVPFVFDSFTYLGPGSDYELDKHVSVPWANSLPSGNAVIQFDPERK